MSPIATILMFPIGYTKHYHGDENGNKSSTDMTVTILSTKGKGGYNVNRTVDYLQKNKAQSSQGKCARYTTNAIKAGGVSVKRDDAKNMGPNLLDGGMKWEATYPKYKRVTLQSFNLFILINIQAKVSKKIIRMVTCRCMMVKNGYQTLNKVDFGQVETIVKLNQNLQYTGMIKCFLALNPQD